MRTQSIYILLLFMLFFLFLAGCSEHYKTNFVKKFNDYLQYSLGDFEVVSEEEVKWKANPVPANGTGKRWVIAFTDDRGINREFEFLNYGYTQGGDASNFGYAVMEYAMELGQEQIIADVLLKYFRPDEIGLQDDGANELETSVLLFNEYPEKGDDNYANFVDRQIGLQLKSIHPKQLIHEWGASYSFHFAALIDDEEKMTAFIAKIEQILRDYLKYVDHDDLPPIEVNGTNNEEGYRGIYHKETDTFSWITKKDYLESLKYIDGNLKNVEAVIINDKEYVVGQNYADANVYSFAGMISYCSDTEQYHIRDFEDLLILLGYDVSDLDRGTTFEWKIGADSYTLSKLKSWSLEKNGGSNLLKYDGHKCQGLSQTDFEMVSNTTANMDKEKAALVVKSNYHKS